MDYNPKKPMEQIHFSFNQDLFDTSCVRPVTHVCQCALNNCSLFQDFQFDSEILLLLSVNMFSLCQRAFTPGLSFSQPASQLIGYVKVPPGMNNMHNCMVLCSGLASH